MKSRAASIPFPSALVQGGTNDVLVLCGLHSLSHSHPSLRPAFVLTIFALFHLVKCCPELSQLILNCSFVNYSE